MIIAIVLGWAHRDVGRVARLNAFEGMFGSGEILG